MTELVAFDRETLNTIASLHDGEVLNVVSLDLPAGIDYDRYEALGVALGALDRACKWWIGDWLVTGEALFPDRYEQAMKVTGLSQHTLENRASISRAIAPERRKPLVSYSCHRIVSKLAPREQRRWLSYADRHQSTVLELHAAMREAEEPKAATSPRGEPDVPSLIEAARSLVRNAEQAGENVIVRREDYAMVVTALGQEE